MVCVLFVRLFFTNLRHKVPAILKKNHILCNVDYSCKPGVHRVFVVRIRVPRLHMFTGTNNHG